MGNKNSALPLLAAALLTGERVMLRNVPDIGDVRVKLRLLESLGVLVSFGDHVCEIDASKLQASIPDALLSSRIRTSVLLAAPLLVRLGRAEIARPGGDRIGRRNLDTHLFALQALGANVEVLGDSYRLTTLGLHSADVFLDEMSVTGTEQAILAAVLATGVSQIKGHTPSSFLASMSCVAQTSH